jgi:hypothetical protein
MVTSFFVYNTYPTWQRSVSYMVKAVGSGGLESEPCNYATFIREDGPLPERLDQ